MPLLTADGPLSRAPIQGVTIQNVCRLSHIATYIYSIGEQNAQQMGVSAK